MTLNALRRELDQTIDAASQRKAEAARCAGLSLGFACACVWAWGRTGNLLILCGVGFGLLATAYFALSAGVYYWRERQLARILDDLKTLRGLERLCADVEGARR